MTIAVHSLSWLPALFWQQVTKRDIICSSIQILLHLAARVFRLLHHPESTQSMPEHIPDTCILGKSPGEKQESECQICQERISADTDTVTHRSCGRTFCSACFFLWTRTAGPRATCPNCRPMLQSHGSEQLHDAIRQESNSYQQLHDSIEQLSDAIEHFSRRHLEQIQLREHDTAIRAAAFEARVQTALAQRTVTNLATLVERLHTEARDELMS